MSRNTQRGITLIELMVVTAVVAILAAVAYPSYESQIRKSRRAAAQAFLMDVAARQQQRMVDVRSYATSLAALNVSTPSEISGYYAVDTTPVAQGFTVTATPTGAQLKDSGCPSLSLSNTGVKLPAGCW